MDSLLFGRRVLVVEDEMMILLNIEDMLADLGCATISSAGTVARALVLVDGEHFDLAMLDMNLSGQTSYPIADALAVHNVPFVFLTGYSDDRLAERFSNRPVLKKPYSARELGAALAKLLPAAP
ncbi:MAG: response regulator [Hyphomonas sp.]